MLERGEGREKETEGEKGQCERETLISRAPPTVDLNPQPRLVP